MPSLTGEDHASLMSLKGWAGAVVLAATVAMSPGRAEDWTTTDGKTYRGISIVSHDATSVTIMDEDGGATLPLASLPPKLQKKFGYDPVKAAASLGVERTKIRLVGLVEAKVAGGYILGKFPSDREWSPAPDASRPPSQYASDIADGGTVFLQTADEAFKDNDAMDVDAYPIGQYVDAGQTMKAFTTDLDAAVAFQVASRKR